MSIFSNNTRAHWIPALLAIFAFFSGAHASPSSGGAEATLYQQVVVSPLRTEEDRSADAYRKPFEFLQFAGVRQGMKVLDIGVGGGYTTQLLALAAGSKGAVWAQANKLSASFEKRMADHPQTNIVPVVRPYDDPLPEEAPELDLITLILFYHDIAAMPVDRTKMNRRLFNALKPGGHLVVIDHLSRDGAGITMAKSLHRIEESVVLNELREAGFQLEEQSDFLRNPSDSREQAFFNMKIPTDNFALRFSKPK